nr:hypothetical protein [uncultured Arsenicibacter sp.]
MTAAINHLFGFTARDLLPLYGQLGFVYTGYMHNNPKILEGKRIKVRRGNCSFWTLAKSVRYIGINWFDVTLTDINGRTTITTGSDSAETYAACLGFGSHAEMYQALLDAHGRPSKNDPSPVIHGLLIEY